MKLNELRITQQEQEINEMSELFAAIGRYNVMLSEGKLDEAGAWNAIKGAAGAVVGKVKTANDAIDRLGQLAQNTAPVKGFDNKVEDILKKIGAANPKVADAAKRYGEWAKANPIKQGLIIGMLTAIASLVTGPGGGAAAGAVLRAGNELLKGEKASTAIGKSIKTAGLAWVAGLGIRQLGDMLATMKVNVSNIPGYQKLVHVGFLHEVTGLKLLDIETSLPPETAAKLDHLVRLGNQAAKQHDWRKAVQIYNTATKIVENPELQNVIDQIKANNWALYKEAVEGATKLKELFKGLSAAAQGAIAGVSTATSNKQTPPAQQEPQAQGPAQQEPQAQAPAQKSQADIRADLKQRQAAMQQRLRQQGQMKEGWTFDDLVREATEN